MGFHVTDDLADVSATTVWPGFGPLDQENIFNCSGGSPCPWHGTDVAGAAMGIPDNQFGSAGPAGPVAEPILVFTLYDYFTSIGALGAAVIGWAYVMLGQTVRIDWRRGIKQMLAVGEGQAEWNIIMASAMLAMIPPVLIVIFMQKQFVRGMTETEK